MLFIASAVGAAMLLPVSLAFGEQVIPRDWTWVLLLAIGSQVIGQGLLVYAIGALSPLVVGLALLTQPAISALIGWLAYGERLRAIDWVGAAAIAAALVLRIGRTGSDNARMATSIGRPCREDES